MRSWMTSRECSGLSVRVCVYACKEIRARESQCSRDLGGVEKLRLRRRRTPGQRFPGAASPQSQGSVQFTEAPLVLP